MFKTKKNHVLLFLKAKYIIDILLNDKNLVEKINKFINTERALVSDEYITSYLEVDDIISKKIKKETIRIVIMKSDGAYFYDSTFDNFGVVGIQNHNGRPEVLSSLQHFYGNSVSSCYANKFPKQLKKIVLEGYGIALRSSSTNKKLQCYVAKTYSDNANPLSENVFTLRVSLPVDDISGKRSLQSNKELEKPRKATKKPASWSSTGIVNQKNSNEVVAFLLASVMGSNPKIPANEEE
jgi:hypothetical protein